MTDRPKPEQDEKTGRFVSGNSGGGRPRGSRNKLGEAFVTDLLAAWEQKGKQAIDNVIEDRPQDFLKVVAGLLPKEVNVNSSAVQELEDDELASLLAVARQIAGASTSEGTGKGKRQTGSRKPSKGVSTLQ